jgi:hypothetical protein
MVNFGYASSVKEMIQRMSFDLLYIENVSLILDFLANGDSVQDILESYPDLTIEDIQACIAYGAAMSRERFVPVELEPAA